MKSIGKVVCWHEHIRHTPYIQAEFQSICHAQVECEYRLQCRIYNMLWEFKKDSLNLLKSRSWNLYVSILLNWCLGFLSYNFLTTYKFFDNSFGFKAKVRIKTYSKSSRTMNVRVERFSYWTFFDAAHSNKRTISFF